MKELKIHSLNGITLVKKALKFLKENTPEIPPYEFSNKKSKLGDNLICDFIVGKDNKVLGFSVYWIKAFELKNPISNKVEYNCDYWVSGYFDQKGQFIGCRTGIDNLCWNFY